MSKRFLVFSLCALAIPGPAAAIVEYASTDGAASWVPFWSSVAGIGLWGLAGLAIYRNEVIAWARAPRLRRDPDRSSRRLRGELLADLTAIGSLTTAFSVATALLYSVASADSQGPILGAGLVAVGSGVFAAYRRWKRPAGQDTVLSPVVDKAELLLHFDNNPGNGRVAARLISVAHDAVAARRIYDAFTLSEPKTFRYAPTWALALVLHKAGKLAEALELVRNANVDAAFYSESAKRYGEHPERGDDLEAYSAARREFFLDAGGPADFYEDEP